MPGPRQAVTKIQGAAGGDGLFVPGLTDAEDIEWVGRRSPLPLNFQ